MNMNQKVYLVNKVKKIAVKEFDNVKLGLQFFTDNKGKYNKHEYSFMSEGEAKRKNINLDIEEGLDYNENISESDIRIITGNGYNVKIVNKYWNMWNKIKNRRDQEDWEKKVGLLRFGSHLTETLSDIIKRYNEDVNLSVANRIVIDNFIKEIEKAVEKYNTKEYRNQIVKEDTEIAESTSTEKLAKIKSAYYYLRNKKKEMQTYQFNKKYGEKWFKVKLMFDKMKEGKLTSTDKKDANKMTKTKSLKSTAEDKKAMDYFKAEAKKYTLKADELKHRWDKAKDVAKYQGKDKDWGYIRGIYKKMTNKYLKENVEESMSVNEGKMKRQQTRQMKGKGKDKDKIKTAYKYLLGQKKKLSADDFEAKYGDQWITIKKLYEDGTVNEDMDVSEGVEWKSPIRAKYSDVIKIINKYYKKLEDHQVSKTKDSEFTFVRIEGTKELVDKIVKELRSISSVKEDISEGKMATHLNDDLLQGMSFQDLIDTILSNEKKFDEATVRKVFMQMVTQRLTDAKAELRDNMKVIIKALGVREDMDSDISEGKEEVDAKRKEIDNLAKQLDALFSQIVKIKKGRQIKQLSDSERKKVADLESQMKAGDKKEEVLRKEYSKLKTKYKVGGESYPFKPKTPFH